LGVASQLIGIGIGIELTDPEFPKLLAYRVATLSELRQRGHKTIEQCLLRPVVVCGQRLAHWQHVLNRSALQRRTSCDSKIPARVPVRRVVVTLGPLSFNSLQRDRLPCAQQLILRVAVSLQLLATPVGPTDRGDGRSVYVELLMAECHLASSLSIPIPIATPTPAPIALRPPTDIVVQFMNEPFLSGDVQTGEPSHALATTPFAI